MSPAAATLYRDLLARLRLPSVRDREEALARYLQAALNTHTAAAYLRARAWALPAALALLAPPHPADERSLRRRDA